jgi:hypothetical protein
LFFWDVWKRRAICIPGHALVLNTFIIQLLSFTDYSHISVYSANNYKTKEVVAVLVKKQLVIDSGRLMMCVVMAYFLPGMARPGSTMVGGDLTTLALSIILNIVSELHSAWKEKKPNELSSAPPPEFNLETKSSHIEWSMVSNRSTQRNLMRVTRSCALWKSLKLGAPTMPVILCTSTTFFKIL